MAVNKVAEEIAPRATCVMLLPDRGERYLDTIFSDEWVVGLQRIAQEREQLDRPRVAMQPPAPLRRQEQRDPGLSNGQGDRI